MFWWRPYELCRSVGSKCVPHWQVHQSLANWPFNLTYEYRFGVQINVLYIILAIELFNCLQPGDGRRFFGARCKTEFGRPVNGENVCSLFSDFHNIREIDLLFNIYKDKIIIFNFFPVYPTLAIQDSLRAVRRVKAFFYSCLDWLTRNKNSASIEVCSSAIKHYCWARS